MNKFPLEYIQIKGSVYVPACPLRMIFKLESQVKQLEHANQARARFASHSNTRPSGAG